MKARRVVLALFAGVLAVGLNAAVGSAAQAAPNSAVQAASHPMARVVGPNLVTPNPDRYYELFLPGVSSTECMDVPSGSHGVVPIQMFHCHGYASDGAPQLWNVFPVGTDALGRPMYEIFNKAGNGCIQPRSATFGAQIWQGVCNGDPWQEWALTSPFDPNRFMLVNEWSQQCLTTNGSTADHTPVIQRTCDFEFYNALQYWQLG